MTRDELAHALLEERFGPLPALIGSGRSAWRSSLEIEEFEAVHPRARQRIARQRAAREALAAVVRADECAVEEW